METPPKSKKIDRRAARSKRLIIEAYRELVLEKEPTDVTVSDIVKRADIGRATFYAHFEDKAALERFLFGQLLKMIEMGIEESVAAHDGPDLEAQKLLPSRALFQIGQARYPLFKKNAASNEFGLIMLLNPLVDRMERQLDALDLPHTTVSLPRRTAATFLVSGCLTILARWIMEDMPYPPEEMDRQVQALAAPTIAKLLGK